MLYLEKFLFPDLENDALSPQDCSGSFYDENCYPFHLTSEMGLWSLDFEPLTMLYGGNGSGKSTVINVIGQKLCADRHSMFNRSPHFEKFVERCQYRAAADLAGDTIFGGSRQRQKYDISKITTVLTSDDIFHWMLDLREENDKKLQKSKFLFEDYCSDEELPRHLNFETGYNVEKYRLGVEMRKARGARSSFNKFLLKNVGKMERGFSNGETALMKLTELIEKPGLYLLDEPENSMSCEFQIKLAAIINYLSRRGDCQFLISTHSPFLLSLPGAKIYNLDSNPVDVCRWWELENMNRYFELFESNRDKFGALKG